MPRYQITETVEYELEAADDYSAMHTFLANPAPYMTGVTSRAVFVDREGTGWFVGADDDEIRRAEDNS